MKMLNALTSLAGLALLLALPITDAHADAGWTGFGMVQEIHVDESGEFFVRVTGIDGEKSGCKNNGWYSHYSKTPGHQKIYEAVLLAFSDNKTLKLWVAGTCNQWNYANFTAVSVRR